MRTGNRLRKNKKYPKLILANEINSSFILKQNSWTILEIGGAIKIHYACKVLSSAESQLENLFTKAIKHFGRFWSGWEIKCALRSSATDVGCTGECSWPATIQSRRVWFTVVGIETFDVYWVLSSFI